MGGTYIVQAHYLGTTGPYIETTATPITLDVNRANATLGILTSSPSVTKGQNITVTLHMSPFVNGANVTVSYTFDNKTFVPIHNMLMTSPTMSFNWIVTVSGSFTLAVTWPGDQNYNPALGEVMVNKQ